jgi:hypothetical protein
MTPSGGRGTRRRERVRGRLTGYRADLEAGTDAEIHVRAFNRPTTFKVKITEGQSATIGKKLGFGIVGVM